MKPAIANGSDAASTVTTTTGMPTTAGSPPADSPAQPDRGGDRDDAEDDRRSRRVAGQPDRDPGDDEQDREPVGGSQPAEGDRPLAVGARRDRGEGLPEDERREEDEEQGGVGADHRGVLRQAGSASGVTAAVGSTGVQGKIGDADKIPFDQHLGDLDGVRGRALAEVVADDPEVQAAIVRGIAADRGRRAPRRGPRRRSPAGRCPSPGSSTTTTPGARRAAPAGLGSSGSRVSTLTDSDVRLKTGTRTQVAEMPTSSPTPRIFRVSAIILRSSVV